MNEFPNVIQIHNNKNGTETYTFSDGKVFPNREKAMAYYHELHEVYLATVEDPVMRRLAQEILAHRNDYMPIIDPLIQDQNFEGLRGCLGHVQFRSECVYQGFTFKNEIKEYYYAGRGFGQLGNRPTINEGLGAVVEGLAENGDFMEGLVKHFFEIFGEGNYYYDFWEFGSDDFVLFFGIYRSVYKEKMRLIAEWIEKEGIDSLVSYKEKTLDERV